MIKDPLVPSFLLSCYLILPLHVFLRNLLGKKQGIQVSWPIPIHQWWISRVRRIYRTLTAFEMELFLILVKDFRPLCTVRRSSLLVNMGSLYLLLYFIIIVEHYTLEHYTRSNYCSCYCSNYCRLPVCVCFFQFLHLP